MMPERIVAMEALPRNERGKIDYPRLTRDAVGGVAGAMMLMRDGSPPATTSRTTSRVTRAAASWRTSCRRGEIAPGDARSSSCSIRSPATARSWLRHAPDLLAELARDTLVVLPECGRSWFIDDHAGDALRDLS